MIVRKPKLFPCYALSVVYWAMCQKYHSVVEFQTLPSQNQGIFPLVALPQECIVQALLIMVSVVQFSVNYD